MDITWLGHSCFRIKGKNGTVITDPYDPALGYQPGKLTADIVTVSHTHPGHSFVNGIGGQPKVIKGPGEYEIAGIFIYGTRTFHDAEKGKLRGKNTCYLIEIDEIRVCHLGDLGHVPSASQVDEISDAEVLLIPVGGKSTTDASTAVEIVHMIGPSLVIPMHYKVDGVQIDLEPVDRFLAEMGIKEVSPIPKLSLNRNTMPPETQVVILDHRH